MPSRKLQPGSVLKFAGSNRSKSSGDALNLFLKKPIDRLLAESEGAGDKGAGLRRTLSATSLVALGIGAIIGAGIFTLTGVAASTHAGPALVYSFILAAIGCAFAGLCYSDHGRVAGLDHRMGSDPGICGGSGDCRRKLVGYHRVNPGRFQHYDSAGLLASPFDKTPGTINLLAVVIVAAISTILIVGVQESARFNTVIVFIKVAVVILFIVVGYFYIDKSNYTPFVPPNTTGEFGAFGWSGVLAAAGQIFFAYIGFDAVSTAAQEAKNPKRDMPIGIIGSLAICTVLYILYSMVLTGVVNYKDLNVAAPLAVAVDRMNGVPWLGKLMKLGSLLGLTSVILVMLLGQSRVFYSMSRDGLLPKAFSDVHPKFHTPWRSNLMLMIFVSLGAAFTPIAQLGNLTSIGTLFAFVLVCLGIVIMRRTDPDLPRPFRTPWVPVLPILGVLINFLLMLGLGALTWTAFLIWMAIGLALYFSYSRFRSRLLGSESA